MTSRLNPKAGNKQNPGKQKRSKSNSSHSRSGSKSGAG